MTTSSRSTVPGPESHGEQPRGWQQPLRRSVFYEHHDDMTAGQQAQAQKETGNNGPTAQ